MPAIFGESSGCYYCIECKYETREKFEKGQEEIKIEGGCYNDDFNSKYPRCKEKDTLVELP